MSLTRNQIRYSGRDHAPVRLAFSPPRSAHQPSIASTSISFKERPASREKRRRSRCSGTGSRSVNAWESSSRGGRPLRRGSAFASRASAIRRQSKPSSGFLPSENHKCILNMRLVALAPKVLQVWSGAMPHWTLWRLSPPEKRASGLGRRAGRGGDCAERQTVRAWLTRPRCVFASAFGLARWLVGPSTGTFAAGRNSSGRSRTRRC